MNLTLFVVAATALGGQALLVASVIRRAIAGPPLRTLLDRHALLPTWARKPTLAAAVELAQLGIGGAGSVSIVVLGPQAAIARVTGLASSVIYAGFAGYLVTLLYRRGRLPCGCLSEREPVGWPAIARAVLLVSLAGTTGALNAGTGR